MGDVTQSCTGRSSVMLVGDLSSLWDCRGGVFLISTFPDKKIFHSLSDFSPAKNTQKNRLSPDKMALNGKPGMKRQEGPADGLQEREWAEHGMIC